MKEGAPGKTKDSAVKEAFDPLLELEKIRQLPKEERKQAVKSYKEKLMAQKEGVAELEEFLRGGFRERSDAGEEYFLSTFEKEAAKHRLTKNQYAIFRDTIREAAKRRVALKDWRKKFPDDRGLFKKFFGFSPRGDIKVELGPLNFKIKIYNIHDFARISEDGFLKNRPATKEEIDEALITYGKTLTPLPKSLDRAVVILNFSEETKEEAEGAGEEKPAWPKLIAHEEQHVFNALLDEQKIEKYFGKALSLETPQEKNQVADWLALIIRTARRHGAEWNFKNETLAFLRGETAISKIREILLDKDGHYSQQWFVNKAKRAAKIYLTNLKEKEREEQAEPMEKLVEKIMGDELLKVERKALDAADQLEKSGVSRDKIVALLQNEPLTEWPNFARRYLKQ